MKSSIWYVFKQKLTFKSFSIIIPTAILYLASSAYLLNLRLVISTITGDFPISYKSRLMYFLLGSLWTNMNFIDFILSITISFLVGINLFLLIKTFDLIRDTKVKITFGGGSILGITAASCASCGISILSLLGISATLGFIPFEGTVIKISSIILLLFSVFYVANTIRNSSYCEI